MEPSPVTYWLALALTGLALRGPQPELADALLLLIVSFSVHAQEWRLALNALRSLSR